MKAVLPLAILFLLAPLLPAAPQGICPGGYCLETEGMNGGVTFTAQYTECPAPDDQLDIELCVTVQGTAPGEQLHLSKNGVKFYFFATDQDGNADFCIRRTVDAGPDGRPAGARRCDDGDLLRVFSRLGQDVDVAGVLSPCTTLIRGIVFYDIDENGEYEPGLGEAGGWATSLVDADTPIEDWKVQLQPSDGGEELMTVYTAEDGSFEFEVLRDGTVYELFSTAPPPGLVGTPGGRWLGTTPMNVQVLADVTEVRVDFGNLAFENTPGTARSKGYWHNAGEDELLACDPEWRTVLNGLCLRTNFSNPNGEEGTLFTVSETDDFSVVFGQSSNYLTDPAYGVLAFILSVQVAAAHYNTTCGPLEGLTTFIDQEGNDVLVPFEVMAAGTIAVLCNPRSANTGPHGDQEWRAVIMQCLDEWEQMNSNGGGTYNPKDEPIPFEAPY